LSSMNDDDVPGTALATAGIDAAESSTFPGDQGELRLDTRRVLVQLLQGPAVDGHRQTKLWPVLLRDERILRIRLHDLFLELIIDHDQKVAFTRQVVEESIDAPILLRKATLTFLQSALILYLRQRLTQAETQGERAVVARSDMVEHLRVYERDHNVDHARFEQQMDKAVEKAKELSLLHKLRGGEDRFEVSPTLKLLFPAEEIIALAKTYEALAEDARRPFDEDDEVLEVGVAADLETGEPGEDSL
jgi:hypothetical protein